MGGNQKEKHEKKVFFVMIADSIVEFDAKTGRDENGYRQKENNCEVDVTNLPCGKGNFVRYSLGNFGKHIGDGPGTGAEKHNPV